MKRSTPPAAPGKAWSTPTARAPRAPICAARGWRRSRSRPSRAQVDAAGRAGGRGLRSHLSTTELALFTRQLASLLEASLPLEQAFSALLEQAERPYLRDLIASIRSDVMGGASLSDALSQHPRDFADIYRALVVVRRADRPAGARAVAPGRLHRAPQRAGAKGQAGVHLSGHRHRGGVRDRDLPADLRGAADRFGVRQHQAEAAAADGDDAGDLGLRAQLRLDRGADRRRAVYVLAPAAEKSGDQAALARLAAGLRRCTASSSAA